MGALPAACDGRSQLDTEEQIVAHDTGDEQHRGGAGARVDDGGVTVGCDMMVTSVVASANRGGKRIGDEVMVNHDLLRAARAGDVAGLTAALEKGAWTETRRPLVMKPQKTPDGGAADQEDEANIGMTALMFSAKEGKTECLRRLLLAGAEIDAIEEDGWTSLHFAAKDGNLDCCRVLIENGCATDRKNADDLTPLQVAKEEDEYTAKKLNEMLQRLQKPQD